MYHLSLQFHTMGSSELNHSPDCIGQIAALYPYVEGSEGYGVPFEHILGQHTELGYVLSGSRRGLYFKHTDTVLFVRDVSDGRFELYADVDEHQIFFSTYTRSILKKSRLSDPHPDFFAEKFIQLCIAYYPGIDTLKAQWKPESINYYQFTHAIQDGLSQFDAVNHTVCAQQFAQHQFYFSPLQEVYEHPDPKEGYYLFIS